MATTDADTGPLDPEVAAYLRAYVNDVTAEEVLAALRTGFVFWNVVEAPHPDLVRLRLGALDALDADGKDVAAYVLTGTSCEKDLGPLPEHGDRPGFDALPMDLLTASTAMGAEVVVVTDGRGEPFVPLHPHRWTWILVGGGEDWMSQAAPDMRVVRA